MVTAQPIITRRSTCRACGGRNLELVFQLAPSPIGDAYVTREKLGQVQECYPIDLFLCRDCGLSQLLDIIAPELLYRDYIYQTGSSLGLAEHFRRYAEAMLEDYSPAAGSLVVDIGSNDGTLLRFFKDRGMRVLGVDPAQETAAAATLGGITTLPTFFDSELARKIRQEHGPATFITANNVFANIDDLEPIIDGVRILLAEDGVFAFESFYLADVIRNLVFDFIYHEHISAFSVKPVRALFDRLGMELFDAKHVETKGGSLRYLVRQKGRPRAVSSAIATYIAEEEEMGLFQPKRFASYSSTIDKLKAETRGLLEDLRGNSNTIAGFGASITGTTLIYHFGLGDYLEYLVDDNPAKQGRFSPGLHLPVYPGEALFQRQPDYALILAWRFAEPIITKYQAFLDQGRHFIIPVPRVKVL